MSRLAEQPSSAPSSAPFGLSDVKRTVVQNVCAAELIMQPSPHIYVEKIFPEDFYSALIKHFPEDGTYARVIRSGNPRAQHRRLFSLTNDVERIGMPARGYWQAVRETIASDEFITALNEKFNEPLHRRYGDKLPRVFIRLELIRDNSGYAIGPHTDAPHKIFTGLFYLPADASQVDLGTSMFMPKQRDFTEEQGRQFPFEQFEECTKMPFLPNSLFLFMKTQNSFHGRYALPEGIAPRNWMNCSVQIAELYR
jgi:hypothetical protein